MAALLTTLLLIGLIVLAALAVERWRSGRSHQRDLKGSVKDNVFRSGFGGPDGGFGG